LPTPATVPLEPPDRHGLPPQLGRFMKWTSPPSGTHSRRPDKISRAQH
jgi:hypothetical protein